MKKNTLILIFLMIVLITGCGNNASNVALQNIEQDDYILFVKEKSDIIKNSLEQDTLTQTDMNIKSQELYELWDDALNYLWGELKNSLLEEEFEKLQAEQRIWIEEKEKTIEEAGKEVKGGSIYSLVVNREAARITEERVYELLKE